MNKELQNFFDCVHYILFHTIYMFFQAQVSLYHWETSFIRGYLTTWIIYWSCYEVLKIILKTQVVIWLLFMFATKKHCLLLFKNINSVDLFKLLIKQTLFNIKWHKIYIAVLRTKCKCNVKSLWTYVWYLNNHIVYVYTRALIFLFVFKIC